LGDITTVCALQLANASTVVQAQKRVNGTNISVKILAHWRHNQVVISKI